MIVIIEEEVRKIGGAMVAGLIGSGVSPLAGDGLDEAFGLAVGLGAIGFGEEMFEAELLAGGGEVAGAVGRAAIGQKALDGDAMGFEEGESLVESGEDALDLFVREEAGEGETAVVVDGDVAAFDASARIAEGAIAGGADAGPREAAQFLDVEMKEFARVSALVALWRSLGAFERGEAMKAVLAQDAGDGGLGDVEDGEDLGVGPALTTQSKDVGDQAGTGAAGLAVRNRGEVLKLGGEALGASARLPPADGALADVVSRGDLAQGETGGVKISDHFGSHPWGESGISVHVVRAGWLGIAF
jgi:hypothetical protein